MSAMKDLADLQSENTELHDRLNIQGQRIEQLEAMVKELRHQRFAASSEKQSPDQQHLFDEAEQDVDIVDDSNEEDIVVTPHTRKKKKRVSIPTDIPREDRIYDLREEEKVCPHDGTALKAIGEETHEQLDIIPAQIKAIRHNS